MTKKISELSDAGVLAGTEQVEVNAGGTSKRTTSQGIANLAGIEALTSLLPLGKVTDDVSGTELGAGEAAIYDPASTAIEDGGWIVTDWAHGGFLTAGFEDLTDSDAVVCEMGINSATGKQGVFHVYRWNTLGDVEIYISEDTAAIHATAVPGQTNSVVLIKDSSNAPVFEVTGDNKVAFHGAAGSLQSVAGTTAADAIACLKAHGLMAT